MSRFSEEKHEAFDAELGVLMNRYLAHDDVDAMSLATCLDRRSREAAFIGADERRKFRERRTQGES